MTTKTRAALKVSASAQALIDSAKAVSVDAFNASESRAKLTDSIRKACGPKPSLQVFDAIRHATIIGIMASSLARKGDNRKMEDLLAHCDLRLTKYQGYGGLAPVRDGMLGRRTEDEEKAYTNGRTQWTGLIRDAGVTVPDGKSGGANNSTGAAGKAGNSKNAGKTGGATAAAPAAPAKVSDVVPTPKFTTEKQAVAWAKREAAAMLATINGSAKATPSWLKSAVADFHKAVKSQTAAEVPAK